MPLIRIQKYLSQQGICSRRKAEEFILKGWVLLNGEVLTELGVSIDPDHDHVELTKEANNEINSFIYLLVNKPRGIVTNNPTSSEKEIKSILPKQYQHLSAIGRLDKESEGLILFTNDGIFAKKMLDHNNPHRREYLIKVNKPLTDTDLDDIRDGMFLSDYKLKPCEIDRLSPLKYRICLYEGKNRQIRRMIQKVGSHVVFLQRLSFSSYHLDMLSGKLFKEISL